MSICIHFVNQADYYRHLPFTSRPAAVLPLRKQCSTAVRFCPVLFELHADGPVPVVNLPYRMVFAVSTDHDVILYDTQQATPFARFQEIHYTRLTDLTWSSDGRLLIASSTDGFCALITFEAEELGVPYVQEGSETEDNPQDVSGCEELEREETEVAEKPKEKKRASFIEQWAIKTPKRMKLEETGGDVVEIVEDEDEAKELSSEIRKEINKLIPRRATAGVTRIDDKSVAKPIAVRRKPKSDEAKPIEVRRKPRDLNESKENKPVNNHPAKASTEPTNAEIEEKLAAQRVECPEIIEIDDEPDTEPPKTQNVKGSKSQRKDTETPKIKVSALTKKKNTPTKNSPLLKFLKSAEKPKKPARTTPSTASVDLTLAEEARDAWKCEKEISSVTTSGSKDQPAEEDCTEDFCLQLEDTQEAERKNDTNETENADGEKVIEISENSNDSTGIAANRPTTVRNTEQKVPRRVTLITLESPKGKKKQKL